MCPDGFLFPLTCNMRALLSGILNRTCDCSVFLFPLEEIILTPCNCGESNLTSGREWPCTLSILYPLVIFGYL